MRKKPRHTLNGNKDMCGGCYYINCDPLHSMLNTRYIQKRNFRLRNNLCVGCGNNPCKCKNNEHCNIRD